MIRRQWGCRLRTLAALSFVITCARPAAALPTMIRLGYPECGACHISPQGGGPLNIYGRGIDQAQSLRGGEYTPPDDSLSRILSFGGRTTQDLRLVMQETANHTDDGWQHVRFWPRLMYRNATELGNGFRVSAIVTGEVNSTVRPALSYDPAADPSSWFVNTALLHYRVNQRIEFAAGRDQLPTGVNVPDLGLAVRSRNRLGYYDAPTQAKMFWTTSRFRVTPFVYRAAENEPAAERETGGGAMLEAFATNRLVFGVSLLGASATGGDRKMIGGYTRLGFGQWGILAEYDHTPRTRQAAPGPVAFSQDAAFGQVFWAIREWLVASGVVDRLHVDQPFEESTLGGRFELAARLSSEATLSVNVRRQQDRISGRAANSVVLQAAFKTVH